MSEKKYLHLLEILEKHDKLGVAFSGGVDSTLLLYAAVEALGRERVTALFISSSLIPKTARDNCRAVLSEIVPQPGYLKEIDIEPLEWTDFVSNDKERCYVCKKRMYQTLKAFLLNEACHILADGTNVDDLGQDRPGLRAVRELGVITPLVEADLGKNEIRTLLKARNLSNFSLPSNSCLATRVQKNREIERGKLRFIEQAEHFLHTCGFHGCRVRPEDSRIIVEIQRDQMESFVEGKTRDRVLRYFHELGHDSVLLNLVGR